MKLGTGDIHLKGGRVDLADCGPPQPHAIGPRFVPESRQSFLNRLVAFAKFLALLPTGDSQDSLASAIGCVWRLKRLVRGLEVQRLDQRAVGLLAVCTSGDGIPEDPLHRSEIRDLGPDIFQVRASHHPDLGARSLALIGEFEELPDSVDGEAERAGAADKRQPLEVVLAVESVAPGTSRGGG